jgi:hypothetical protein
MRTTTEVIDFLGQLSGVDLDYIGSNLIEPVKRKRRWLYTRKETDESFRSRLYKVLRWENKMDFSGGKLPEESDAEYRNRVEVRYESK